jgi:FlaA1/EpsC-like NDP-sugar epimerase
LDQQGLRSVVADRIVLVTGAGGSIGGEIARQLCDLLPSRVVLLGRGENSLWETERSLRKSFPNQPLSIELCDIRNQRRLSQAFEHWKPEIVFHAAAHKHVPFLELHPEEAVENNVIGTRNVLNAAIQAGVRFFVNISTDKAVNPTNVLGASKRVAEMLVAEASTQVPGGSHYVSVRFGNVLGSRGSVVPIFKDQILSGGPVTVTHPEMTRYFMTIPEASQLVLQAGLLGETGKVYVLDMGNPVRIVDLARDLINLSGLVPDQDIDIDFSGIRPGEKLFEELFYGEAARSQVHPKVFEAVLEKQDSVALKDLIENLESALSLPQSSRARTLILALCDLVPGYHPSDLGAGRWISTSTQSGKVPTISV